MGKKFWQGCCQRVFRGNFVPFFIIFRCYDVEKEDELVVQYSSNTGGSKIFQLQFVTTIKKMHCHSNDYRGGIFKNYHKNFRLQIRQKQEMFFGDTYDMTSCAVRRLVILRKSSYLNHVPRKLSHDLGN